MQELRRQAKVISALHQDRGIWWPRFEIWEAVRHLHLININSSSTVVNHLKQSVAGGFNTCFLYYVYQMLFKGYVLNCASAAFG